jgi:Fe-S-cluster containining protein
MGEVTNLVVVSNPLGISSCQQCGSCCKNIILRGPFSEKTKEWFIARGCGFMPDESVVIPFKCPHLQGRDGQMKYRCDIYETRPEVCKEYRCWK